MKGLIVDDAAIMRAVLKEILETCGFTQIFEATNGVEAIETYKIVKPDLVTMDLTMPEMDGVTAIQGVMALDPQARIIVCSALGQREMVIKAINAGAKQFIVKPFETEAVVKAIQSLVSA